MKTAVTPSLVQVAAFHINQRYAYRNSSSRTGFFTYWPTNTGHDIRLSETSHFMLHRPVKSSYYYPADLISYAIPSLETPKPEDPVPNGAYLRFGYSPGTSLARTYFSHYGEDETWPVQPVAVHNSSGRLGLYGSSNVLVDFSSARDRPAEFLSNWYICWLFFQDGRTNITSGFFWSVASLDTWNYCTEIDITLEKVVK
ncbi:hypothetical protein KJ359_006534 [Pestalotiopsis sp. 9143b]|nr:hypothetical protein KJ359_006534 [Pestalotiopsis sp. 9143b]